MVHHTWKHSIRGPLPYWYISSNSCQLHRQSICSYTILYIVEGMNCVMIVVCLYEQIIVMVLMKRGVETLLRRQWMQWLVSFGRERWSFSEGRSLLYTVKSLPGVDTIKQRSNSLLKFQNQKEKNPKHYQDHHHCT